MNRVLTCLYRWATGNKRRKKVLSKLYLLCGRYIPNVRRIGDRVIYSQKNGGEVPHADQRNNIAAMDVVIRHRKPLVSVVVPNYEHAPYLQKRLDSIYGQTYRNIEVILLDDASKDGSIEILKEYRARYPEKTRLIRNEKNSGKVFHQWQKGISECRGAYIWIAESDDWCDKDFLEKLVPELDRGSVMLAVAHTWFVEKGIRTWSTEEYLKDTGIDWSTSFCMTAYEIVRRGFGRMNLIPNVSSVLFRNPGRIHPEIVHAWEHMKLCGDWLFYLYLLRGGAISYVADTHDFYRVHSRSTSKKVQKTKLHDQEAAEVRTYAAKYYRLSGKRTETAGDPVPHVLMCAFSLQPGGGEIFPIYLANALWKSGVTVTFLDARMERYEEGIRRKLLPGIPLIELSRPSALGDVAEAYGIDTIHTHHASVDTMASLYVPSNGIRHIITLHGMYETMSREELKGFLPAVCRKCDCFVYIAEKNLLPFRITGWYDKCCFRKIINGIEKRTVEAIDRSTLGIPEEAFVFCLVSRALYAKGWLEAVCAVKQANAESNLAIHLILVGDGEAYGEIQRERDMYIHVVGRQDDPAVFFHAADMGLLPSYFSGESFPLAVLECLMSGRPVLATDVGQLREMLSIDTDQPAGIVIPLRKGKTDSRLLADKMREIAEDPSLYGRLRENTEAAFAPYDIENTAKEYRKVYKGEATGLIRR